MKKPVVVCGIDTDVGKTVVTGLLARHLMEQGKVVITQKPVQTGCKDRSEDILLHRKLMGTGWLAPDEQGLTCSYCFPLPASPHLAAEQAGTVIDPAQLDSATDTLVGQVDQLLIEAAGGLLVPLTRELLLLDYLQSRSFSLILVTTPRLGSINHTLLCLEAIKHRNMELLGLVYNLYGEGYDPRIVTDSLGIFREALARYGFPEKIVLLPDIKESRSVHWRALFSGRSGRE
ncbi:MAG: dethiobiotin synthase [Candidatus Electrothrix sp. GW3-4]|uniref:dethiobiotin synthase n=1 Tax=Candidatus Electrothrix sp. GW3-4 TaxID=3126740 RepID=UPI0030D18598